MSNQRFSIELSVLIAVALSLFGCTTAPTTTVADTKSTAERAKPGFTRAPDSPIVIADDGVGSFENNKKAGTGNGTFYFQYNFNNGVWTSPAANTYVISLQPNEMWVIADLVPAEVASPLGLSNNIDAAIDSTNNTLTVTEKSGKTCSANGAILTCKGSVGKFKIKDKNNKDHGPAAQEDGNGNKKGNYFELLPQAP